MGCELSPRIIYREFSSVIRKQKEVSARTGLQLQTEARRADSGEGTGFGAGWATLLTVIRPTGD